MTLFTLLLQTATAATDTMAAVLDSVSLTLSEGVIVALISVASGLGTWLLTRRAQVRDMTTRIVREAASRDEADSVALRIREIDAVEEFRDTLREELRTLRERVQRLEQELERARLQRLEHERERLEWHQERANLQRELMDAHEERVQLVGRVSQLEDTLQRKALEEYLGHQKGEP